MPFEQACIHSYLTYPTETQSTQDTCYVEWHVAVDKCKYNVNDEVQRIVVSTMVYAVYDLMTDKVEDYKKSIDYAETTQGELMMC